MDHRMMSGRFEGRTALVTGAASGIGAATARRLAAEGARVLPADIANGPARVVPARPVHQMPEADRDPRIDVSLPRDLCKHLLLTESEPA